MCVYLRRIIWVIHTEETNITTKPSNIYRYIQNKIALPKIKHGYLLVRGVRCAQVGSEC